MNIAFEKEILSKDDALRAIRQMATLFGIHIDVNVASRRKVKEKVNEIIKEDYAIYQDYTTEEILNDLKEVFGEMYFSDECVKETLYQAGYRCDENGVWQCNG